MRSLFGLLLAIAVFIAPARIRTSADQTVGGSIAGTVVTGAAAPQPLAGATVMVRHAVRDRRSTGADFDRQAITDEQGRFVFDGLIAGTYELRATKAGYVASDYAAVAPGEEGQALAIAGGQAISGLIIVLARAAVITGTVFDSAGQPVAGVPVAARRSPSAASVKTVVTNRWGAYRLYDLPPGEYVIVAIPEPATVVATGEATSRSVGTAQPYAPVFYPGTTHADRAGRVKVGAAHEVGGIDLTMVLAGTAEIAGVVRDAQGRPAAGVLVSVSPPGSTDAAHRGLSGADGSFRILNVIPGRYTLRARLSRLTERLARGSPIVPADAPATTTHWMTQDVDVDPGGLAGLDLVLQPTLRISGRVVFDPRAASAAPAAPSVRLRLLDDQGNSETPSAGMSPADGGFVIRGVVPGTYTLDVQVDDATWWPRSAVSDGRDLLDLPTLLTADSDEATRVLVTLTNRATELVGTVLDVDGAPSSAHLVVAPADRRLWQPRSRRLAVSRPDTTGRFEVRGLPSGDYLVLVLETIEPRDFWSANRFDEFARAAVTVRLREGEVTIQNLRVSQKSP